jgi:thiosulfate/3-mercaptopyruvate sulfurtransferase
VIYDDTVGLFAARTWWSLRVYGFESARILDGGFPAWAQEGRPLSNAIAPPPVGRFTPRAQPRLRLTTPDVRSLLGSPEIALIDARAPAEYRGFEGNTKRLGHIPGASNVPVGAMSRPGGHHFKTPTELREMLLKANVSRGRRMICYDGSGVAAAKLAFVLTLLGHDDVAVYDGGWAEWGNRLDLPVDR